VEIEHQVRAGHDVSRLIDIRIGGENFGEAGFDDQAELEVRTVVLEERKGGRGEDAVT